MISKPHREFAADVAAGCPVRQPHERDMQKAYMYGLVARTLSQVVLPTAEELLGTRRPNSVFTVGLMLNSSLLSQCVNVLDTDRGLSRRLERAATTRAKTVWSRTLPFVAKEMLRGGVNTAVDVETMTLATIAQRQPAEQVTYDGLIKSQRVPFAFALQHIGVFDIDHEDISEWVWMHDIGGSGAQTRTKVFRPGVTSFTPEKGLMLKGPTPEGELQPRFAGEANIGCPATLVKDFTRNLHTLAADACVQAGVITVSD